MEDYNAKTCPICAETIKAAAKLCPHCRSDQRKFAIHLFVAPWLAGVVYLLIVFGGISIAYRMFAPGRDFAPFRDQVSVKASSMQFSESDKGRYVTTLGTITNGSEYAWKEVQLEVRYFDRQGKLIDVGVREISDVTIQPRSESAFRVRTLADQPESAYAGHKALVRSAKDIQRWP